VPKWIEVQLKIKEEQQEYYKNRRADYIKQMEAQNQLIQQVYEQQGASNEIIRQNIMTIEGNTDALKAAVNSNTQMVEAIKMLHSTMERMGLDLGKLEEQIVQIDKDVVRLAAQKNQ
jgi:hypothetical protein